MDDISRNPEPFRGEGTCLGVKSIGLNEEDGDYITKIKELQDHLDTVKKLSETRLFRRSGEGGLKFHGIPC
ncbi:hypothetical protein Patl1_32460 [Pistacia atlantica]|uniref:Uncharacterized protein n=1 Tax=Pistacia atlantica TaxID=434234 RepID=A0ACC1AM27_9ROSI|nr:hypothetical protein Patl1_32460 [Pistacia atlantica]